MRTPDLTDIENDERSSLVVIDCERDHLLVIPDNEHLDALLAQSAAPDTGDRRGPDEYNITIRRVEAGGMACFEACVEELPVVSELWDTYEEAFRSALASIAAVADVFAKSGRTIPTAPSHQARPIRDDVLGPSEGPLFDRRLSHPYRTSPLESEVPLLGTVRQIQSDLATLRLDMVDLRNSIRTIEGSTAKIALSCADQSVRIDRLAERLERIERKLDLTY